MITLTRGTCGPERRLAEVAGSLHELWQKQKIFGGVVEAAASYPKPTKPYKELSTTSRSLKYTARTPKAPKRTLHPSLSHCLQELPHALVAGALRISCLEPYFSEVALPPPVDVFWGLPFRVCLNRTALHLRPQTPNS